MSDKPRMLWVARDTRGEKRLSMHIARPELHDTGLWSSDDRQSSIDAPGMFDDIKPGESRMFIEFAPRVATDEDRHPEAPARLWWAKNGWSYSAPTALSADEDIILPMPPDPTPYLTQADPNAARREEIRAQIAALQEELEEMEG